ncbi:MAG: galactose-1-phosphate uridylyltransferase [Parcubacteria group bacterium]
MYKNEPEVSELRKNPVSDSWVVIATGRAKRPHAYKIKRAQFQQPRRECPFCNLDKSGTKEPAKIYPLNLKTKYAHQLKRVGDHQKWGDQIWSLIVVPNKFPSFVPGGAPIQKKVGHHTVMPGRGYHEVLITASHDKHFGRLPMDKLEEVMKAYQDRYLTLRDCEYVTYISIIHNHGPEAGASLTHPHSQIFAISVLPRDIKSSLRGSARYLKKYGTCVHCEMVNWEKKKKTRVVYENDDFIVLCPFGSSVAFETRIYPKKHLSYFEEITSKQRKSLAQSFQQALSRLDKALNNPPYNFFLHTAPCDVCSTKGKSRGQKSAKKYSHYHWHFEIMPKISTWAGFELSTGLEISTVDPDQAAGMLKGVKL